MKAGVIILIVLVLIAVVVGGSYVSARNHMVTLNEQVKSDWAQVDVVLQRRSDLIPNLVATVQGFAAHETTVFDDVAKARTQYLNAQTPTDKIAASNELRGAEIKVLALAENYPQLEIESEFPPASGRACRHRKSHRRRAQTLRRRDPGVQHLHRSLPE